MYYVQLNFDKLLNMNILKHEEDSKKWKSTLLSYQLLGGTIKGERRIPERYVKTMYYAMKGKSPGGMLPVGLQI